MVLGVFRRVFTHVRYLQIATLFAATVLSVAIFIPNVPVLRQVLGSSSIDLSTKLSFLGSMYGALFSNFSVVSAVTTVLLSILFGVNIALLTYYVRRRQLAVPNGHGTAAGFFGMISGVFGVGCAACGSVILSAVLTLMGAGGLLAVLPLHGAEFGLLGVGLLMVSVYQLCKRINDPLVCPL